MLETFPLGFFGFVFPLIYFPLNFNEPLNDLPPMVHTVQHQRYHGQVEDHLHHPKQCFKDDGDKCCEESDLFSPQKWIVLKQCAPLIADPPELNIFLLEVVLDAECVEDEITNNDCFLVL